MSLFHELIVCVLIPSLLVLIACHLGSISNHLSMLVLAEIEKSEKKWNG